MGENRPIGWLIELSKPRWASGPRNVCGGQTGAVVEPSGENGCCGQVLAVKSLGAVAEGPFRKIGGCHAIAPRAAAVKGAGALVTGFGVAVRELMNGSVQS